MIKALILIHLWSFVVAGCAWALQRDGDGRVGARFPAPNTWLTLITLCFLPGILYFIPLGAAINLPKIEALEIFPIQINDEANIGTWSLNYLTVYLGLGMLLMSRTLWRWSRLQRLPLEPTAEPGIFTTPAALPPLTLSWPRRVIVIPPGLVGRSALIRHERAHLRHNDAELTLLLLLLQDIMLRNPGMGYLVRQWRHSIELRADHVAITTLTPSERKDYAALLLNIQRPGGGGTRTLPCPTAQLNSTSHRNAKMRLVGILEKEPSAKKRRWGAAILLTSIAATTLGLTSAAATPGDIGKNAEINPDDYVRVNYMNKTPLQLPANCPGLESELKSGDIKFNEEETTVNGQPVSLYTISLGTVILSHHVRKDGSIRNVRILASTYPCFEANAKAHITRLKTEPQEFETKNAVVKLVFKMYAETPEDLNSQLKDYLQ